MESTRSIRSSPETRKDTSTLAFRVWSVSIDDWCLVLELGPQKDCHAEQNNTISKIEPRAPKGYVRPRSKQEFRPSVLLRAWPSALIIGDYLLELGPQR